MAGYGAKDTSVTQGGYGANDAPAGTPQQTAADRYAAERAAATVAAGEAKIQAAQMPENPDVMAQMGLPGRIAHYATNTVGGGIDQAALRLGNLVAPKIVGPVLDRFDARRKASNENYDATITAMNRGEAYPDTLARVLGATLSPVGVAAAPERAALTLAERLAQGGAMGAKYGAVAPVDDATGDADYWFKKLKQTATDAMLTGVTHTAVSPVTSYIAGVAGGRISAPSLAQLRRDSEEAYRLSDATGTAIAPHSYDDMLSRMQAATAGRLDPTLHPGTTAAMAAAARARGAPMTLRELDNLRQNIRDSGLTPGDRHFGRELTDILDDHLRALNLARDIVSGNAAIGVPALERARQSWSRLRKGETLNDIMQQAGVADTNPQATIRAGFRSLANNRERMGRFTPEEQAAIRQVAGGPANQTLGAISHIGSLPGMGVAFAVGGAPAVVAARAAADSAGVVRNALTRSRADMAGRMVRSGAQGYLNPATQKLVNMLSIGLTPDTAE